MTSWWPTSSSGPRTIGKALAAVPLVGTPAADYRLGPAVRERHALLAAALAETRDLDLEWARLATGSAAAARMSTLLASTTRRH